MVVLIEFQKYFITAIDVFKLELTKAWRAAVRGVTKSQTQLSDWTIIKFILSNSCFIITFASCMHKVISLYIIDWNSWLQNKVFPFGQR